MKYLLYILISLILCLSFPIDTYQAASLSLTMSPSSAEITAKPGSSPLVPFIIKNTGDPVFIKYKVASVKATDVVGEIEPIKELEGPLTFGLIGAAFTDTVLFKTNEQKAVSLKITIPTAAPEKDYYYAFFAETIPFPAPEGETTLRFSTTVASPLIIKVTTTGELETKASISLFQVPSKYTLPFIGKIAVYDSFDAIPASLIIKNDGRNTFNSEGSIILNGVTGKQQFLLNKETVLSSTQRLLTSQSDCKDFCKENTSLSFKGFHIGKYTLSSTISFAQNSPYIYASTTFIAFPFKLGLVVVILSLTLFFVRKRLIK